mgnify:CR=1 FL=1
MAGRLRHRVARREDGRRRVRGATARRQTARAGAGAGTGSAGARAWAQTARDAGGGRAQARL